MIVALLWVLVFGSVAAAIDARTHRLPNRLTGLAYVGAAGSAIVRGFSTQSVAQAAAPLAAGLILAGSYLLASMLTSGGLGFGDVKLAAALGTALGYLGFSTLLVASFISTLSASISVLTKRVLGNVSSRQPLAFGPHMMLGYVLAALAVART